MFIGACMLQGSIFVAEIVGLHSLTALLQAVYTNDLCFLQTTPNTQFAAPRHHSHNNLRA